MMCQRRLLLSQVVMFCHLLDLGVGLCRHTQKCRAIAFVLDLCPQEYRKVMPASEAMMHPLHAAQAAAEQLQILVSELTEYDPQVLKKPSVIVLNKIDSTAHPDLVVSEFVAQRSVRDSLAMLPVDTRVMMTSATQNCGLDKLQCALDRLCLDDLHSAARRAVVRSHG
jgi:GTPase involved in cell partitioning and DNA repair